MNRISLLYRGYAFKGLLAVVYAVLSHILEHETNIAVHQTIPDEERETSRFKRGLQCNPIAGALSVVCTFRSDKKK